MRKFTDMLGGRDPPFAWKDAASESNIEWYANSSTREGGSVWLKQWSERNSRVGGNPEVGKYIGIYFAFGFGSAALVVVQTLILWIFCSIEVNKPGSLPSLAHGSVL